MACCQFSSVIRGDHIPHPQTGRLFQINGYYMCNSTYVIYLLKCPCGLVYGGETTQRVRDRIGKHKSTIRCKNLMLPIPHHFNEKGHNVSQLRYQVLEQIQTPRRGGNRIQLLKQRESFWIHRLNSLSPNGLNREFNLAIGL